MPKQRGLLINKFESSSFKRSFQASLKSVSSQASLIELPKIIDDCFLYFAQTPDHIPFTIERIYYITKPNPKLPRGYHAHKKTKQVIFCIQGGIKLTLDNGKRRQTFLLKESHPGVLIDKMVWHEMDNFKKDTILLIIASKVFNPSDYIRDYHQFKKKVYAIYKSKA